MELLLKKKRFTKGKLTRVLSAIEGTEQLSSVDIDIYLSKLEQIAGDIDQLFSSINELCTGEEFTIYQDEFQELEDKLHVSRRTLLSQHSLLNSSPCPPVQVDSKSCDIKLPKLELPTFNGKFHLWSSFRDLFVAAVHKNSTLSGAQKLQYLKSALTDEPAGLISSVPLTDANYTEAWQILNERYQNRREIVAAHLDKFINQPSLHFESASALRSLADTSAESMRALRVLEVPVNHWDAILVHLVVKKLDAESRRQWELSLSDDSIPEFCKLHKFIDQRARALAAAGLTTEKTATRSTPQQKSGKPAQVHHATVKRACEYCQKEHSIYKCDEFQKLTPTQRHQFAKGKQLCFNCLRANHVTADCKSGHCQQCSYRHHTLLHFGNTTKTNQEFECGNKPVNSHFVNDSNQDSQVILATALIKVTNESGRSMVLRALLDSASEASFITEHWVQQLKLKKFKINTPISGIGATGITNAQSGVNLNFTSLIDDKHSFTIHALTLPKITGLLPSTNLDVNNWDHIKSLKLADPQFNKPAKIDVLLGADVFFTLLRSGQLAAPDGLLSVQETVLGWILAGKIQQPPATHIKVHHSTCSTEHILRQFWESEELSASPPLTQEEVQCENHFKTTLSRNEQSRYVVKLPFKQSQPSLGSSRDSAILRLKQIERKLARNPELHKHYSDFLREYVDLKHMEPVPIESIPIQQSYYMPHHPIVKECSLTTKVRVVFDASHKSSNDLSLNDNLMVGPKLQSDLIIILLRFRLHAVAVTADIEKMYRQVLVAKEHVDYQRIVWREKPSDPIQDYNLLTVTYGTASAPYHAIRCLHQLAYDEGKKFPEAAEVLMENFYVDDLILSVPSADQAIHLHQQLVEVLQSAGFHLRKWASNNNLVLDAINQELTSDDNKLRITPKESIKTLGLEWHPRVDQFRFTTASSQHSFAQTLTKRSMLSSIARIFDPLGLLSPATIRAKILLQSLWKLQLDWDEEVDPTTQRHWHDYIHDLKFLDEIHIDRCISLSGECHFELHVFSDASEKAYAAVVYLKSMDSNGCCMVSLVASKTKVAPLKPVSIPRLELCAALLASKLGRLITESLKIKIEKTYAWTDSMVTLSWISSHASRWKSFVAHRVLQIQENMPEAIWKHVPGDENPADCASRGITVHHLASHELWWKGPAWLASNDWPNSLGSFNNEISQQEERTSSTKVLLTSITLDLSIIDQYSNLTKLVRVVALCFRFYKNTKLTTETRIHGFLSVIELNQALNTLIRLVQRVEFSEEIQSLNAGKPISTKSRILPLNPYLDSINLLRVGGRLQKAKIPELQKHPILLPQKCQLTTLIIQDVHLKRLHAGPQLVMSILAGRYWIINCRDVVRRIIRKCVKCFRYQANASQQLMGTLPTARVNPSRAFRHVGVDYAGPLLTKCMKTRSKITYKTYIVLFICFATRAIHLELVSDMSTAAFIATLKRFVARRGKPVEIYSDCGTNFVGANRELKDFLTLIKSKMHNETIGNYLAEEGIQWVFNPPAAPHMGGLWEAGVRSVKHHLKRVVGEVKLTFEELYTLLVQIESCLNSRPITAMSNDPADLSPLTPGHFLIGESLTAIPEPDLSHLTMNRLSRWQLIQKLLQHFWHRWRMEYLSRLQQRPKWYKKEENLKPNDLVLIREDNLPPLQWKLGRIVQTHPGEDGLVRTVTVRSATGEVKRPITKISPLPINEVI